MKYPSHLSLSWCLVPWNLTPCVGAGEQKEAWGWHEMVSELRLAPGVVSDWCWLVQPEEVVRVRAPFAGRVRFLAMLPGLVPRLLQVLISHRLRIIHVVPRSV